MKNISKLFTIISIFILFIFVFISVIINIRIEQNQYLNFAQYK